MSHACDRPKPDGWRCTRGWHADGPCALVPTTAEEITAEAVGEAIQKALEGAVGEAERGILTRWTAIVETIGPDGTKGVWAFAEKGMLPWETLGMLEYGRSIEISRQVRLRLGETEDGE